MTKLPITVSATLLLTFGLVQPLAAARPGAFNDDLLTIYLAAIGLLLAVIGVHKVYMKNKANIAKTLGLNKRTR